FWGRVFLSFSRRNPPRASDAGRIYRFCVQFCQLSRLTSIPITGPAYSSQLTLPSQVVNFKSVTGVCSRFAPERTFRPGTMARWIRPRRDARSGPTACRHPRFVMPSWSRPCQLGIPALLVCGILGLAGRASGQDAVTLAESFQPGRAYRVDVQVKLTG